MCYAFDPSQVCLYSQLQTSGGFCPEGSERFVPETCTWDCGTNGSDCEVFDMKAGYLAQYLDSVTVASGTDQEFVAISGYSPGWLDQDNALFPFGDLVYAQFTPGGNEVVDYTIIDGKPLVDDETNVYFAPDSWRNGNSEPGDDVGKYSSITASATGDLYIAYADFTDQGEYQLKLARRAAGATTFVINVIDNTDPVGDGGAFYPSITLDAAGIPVVAYGIRFPSAAPGGQPTGMVRVATAASATPTGVADWTTVDLAETLTDIGCVEGDGLCATGDRCVTIGTTGAGECGTPDTDCRDAVTMNPIKCSAPVGDPPICVNDVCRGLKVGSDLVDMTGISNNLFPINGGLGLVFHDRGTGFVRTTGTTACETDSQCLATDFCEGVVTPENDNDGHCTRPNGNVWGMRFTTSSTTWGSMFLIDGYSRKRPNIGDCGQHATVAVDAAGAWHVAYLDGTFDRIRYARVDEGATTTVDVTAALLPQSPGVPNPQLGDRTIVVDDGTADYIGTSRPADRNDGRRRLIGGELSAVVTASGEIRILYQDITGMGNTDTTTPPPGAQPLLAVSTTAGLGWAVDYANTGVENGGFWTTQSLGVTTTTTTTSYCAWVERASSVNEGTAEPTPDGAETHVVSCAGP